ncbi:FHA domain-containing protein [Desertihabitans brevis]|uniref:FHA domain-containing protein n=1 Tax=Desertihabitans brevis TaxID=2268447 RepID=A0A367YZ08_9ACTN|nr:FHA domain-containing protein [Desertihabitans brevis]RCK70937.1 FHA domain-containing protein [Desertihabitans brevis]
MTTCPRGHLTTAEDHCDVCGVPVRATTPTPSTPAPSTPAPSDVPGTAGGRTCPHCSAGNAADARYCEVCGHDITTGTGAPPAEPPTTEPMPAVDAGVPGEEEPAEERGQERAAVTADQTAVTPGLGAPSGARADAPTGAVPADAPAPAAAPAAGAASGWVAELWIDPDWYALQNSADPMPSPGPPEVVVLRDRSLLVGRVSRSRGIHPDIACEADSGVSRRHAQLTTDGSRWFVEDLGSANGTFVGPASGPLPEHPVPVGQRVEVGPDECIYLGAWTRMVVRRTTAGEGEDAS